ncbi:MAG: SprT family zinc-dependent metalloprotease [Patescibacteria group bacterium]
MKRQIELESGVFEFDLRVSRRARHLRLSVAQNGAVAVTLPHCLPEFWVERFLRENAEWLQSKLRRIHSLSPPLALKGSVAEYKRYKEEARGLAKNRLEFFNQIYGFQYKRISIRNQGTRWGSCSRNKNLNFNYKVVLLPPTVADYIFVHELCHVVEMNHSRKFWAQVERTIPDWKARRRELRRIRAL